MARHAKLDPQTRILDAAENAIAEFGFAGASLRHIVLEAGVNVATAYYYFRSKRGLMEAVLKRRFGPLREEHLALLRRFEAEAKGRPLPVEKILEAMLLPPLCLAAKAPAKQQAITRLIGRIVTEPNPQIQETAARADGPRCGPRSSRRCSAACLGRPWLACIGAWSLSGARWRSCCAIRAGSRSKPTAPATRRTRTKCWRR